MIFDRYKKNLKIEDGYIVSYTTRVAELNEIRKDQVIQPTKDGEAV